MSAAVKFTIDDANTALACASTLKDRRAAKIGLAVACLMDLSATDPAGVPVESCRQRAYEFDQLMRLVGAVWSKATGVVLVGTSGRGF